MDRLLKGPRSGPRSGPRPLSSPLQWLLVIAVALAVGLAIVAVPRLETRLAMLVIAVALIIFVSVLTGGLRVWMLAAIAFDIPLQMGVYYGFDEVQAAHGALTGYTISITTLALVVLYADWFVAWLLRRDAEHPVDPRWRKAIIAPAAYLVIAAASLFYGQNRQLVIFELFMLVQIFLLFVYVSQRINTRREVLLFIAALLAGLAVEGLIMLYLRASGHEFKLGVIAGRIDVDKGSIGMRIGGTVGSPISAASYLALLMGLAASVWFAPVRAQYKLMAGGALGLATLGLLLTLSRGGWFTAALSIAVLSAAAFYRRWVSPKAVVLLIIVVVTIGFAFQDTIIARLTTDDVGSTAARLPLMRVAWKIISDYPIFGVGLNNYAEVMPPYLSADLNLIWIYTVHNKYLLVWSETGIVGLIAFLSFIAVTLLNGWRIFRLNDPVLAPLGVGIAGGVASQLSHMTLDIFHSRPQVELLWLMAALLTVLLRLSQTKEDLQSQTEASLVALPNAGKGSSGLNGEVHG